VILKSNSAQSNRDSRTESNAESAFSASVTSASMPDALSDRRTTMRSTSSSSTTRILSFSSIASLRHLHERPVFVERGHPLTKAVECDRLQQIAGDIEVVSIDLVLIVV